jgi:deoxyribodipyrimidine photo-lyase
MNIFLFNKSLRCYDNTTLIEQIKKINLVTSLEQNSNARTPTKVGVVPIFVFTEQVNQKKNEYFSNNSVEFMVESLHDLADEIKKYNGELYFFYNDDLIKVLKEIQKHIQIKSLGTNYDYSPYAKKRQELLKEFCDKNNITFYLNEDHVMYNILDGKTNKADGTPYTVFTPYRNHCMKNLTVPKPDSFKKFVFDKYSELKKNKYYISEKDINKFYEYNPNANIRGGRQNGLKILKNIGKFKDYAEQRDYLTYKTTYLSAHNHFGTVSIREVYWRIKDTL